MRFEFFLFHVPVFVALFLQDATASEVQKSHAQYYGLLTPGYGIVSQDDLAYDACRKKIGPYNPNDDLGSLYWQCFPKSEINARYNSWRGLDGGSATNELQDMCSFEIVVHHAGETQVYVDRRGHHLDFCMDYLHAWNRITRSQDTVCLSGDGGFYIQDKQWGKAKLWTWEKFKTKRGCFSYFAGRCETQGSSAKECQH